jgi:hypothetical protein
VVYQEREFNCVNKYVECDYCGRERELRGTGEWESFPRFLGRRKSLLTNARQKPDVQLLARGGNVEGKVGRDSTRSLGVKENGREGELAFMCLVRLFTSLLPASSCCLRTYDWPGIPLKTQRSEGRELAVGGTWRQRAWDDPWREKVTSLTVIGSSELSSEVMCSYDGEFDKEFMHALYSCIYINTGYLYHHHTKSRNAAL